MMMTNKSDDTDKKEEEDGHRHHLNEIEQDECYEQLYVVCKSQSAYQLKLILKRASLFDSRQTLISSPHPDYETSDLDHQQPIIKIPIKLTRKNDFHDSAFKNDRQLENSNLLPIRHASVLLPENVPESLSELSLGFQWILTSTEARRTKNQSASPLRRVIESFFERKIAQLLTPEIPRWESYDNFILFQPNAFQSPNFLKLLDSSTNNTPSQFFEAVAEEFGVSHLARKGLIDRADVSRQPRLIPLYGTFRYRISSDGYPVTFDDAFWTATRFPTAKGPLTYVWAPSETMYSRGNSPEKRRISTLKNVKDTIVVDMCCGIGFFALCYLMAGAKKVIGCEISPWAAEGLRRGAIANGISYKIINQSLDINGDVLHTSSERLLIFHGSNELALPIYRQQATHVNLGLLPSSVEFLPQAVDAIRPEGGWLHIHGELAVGGGPVGRRQGADDWAAELAKQVLDLGRESAKPINIHFIKSIGPAKEHLVLELEVGPRKSRIA